MFRLLHKAIIRHRLKNITGNRHVIMYIKQCLETPFADVVSYIMPVPQDGFLQNSKHVARF